jgi:hypothetical protein
MNYHQIPTGALITGVICHGFRNKQKKKKKKKSECVQVTTFHQCQQQHNKSIQQQHNCLGLYYRGLTPCNECLGVLLHRLVLQKLMISFHVLSLISNRQKWCRYLRYFPDNFIIYTGVLVIGLVYCISSTDIENLLTKTFRSYRRN